MILFTRRYSVTASLALLAWGLIIASPVRVSAQHSHNSAGPERTPSMTKLRTVIPQPGTLFVNTYYLTDSSGHAVPASEANPGLADDSQYVVSVGESLVGHRNVMVLRGPQHPDSTLISFAPNGDIYSLNTERSHGKWEHLEFGLKPGRISKTKPHLDTGRVLGGDYAFFEHLESKVTGWDTVIIGGHPVNCIRLEVEQLSQADPKRMKGVPEAEFGNTIIYWFSPELGYFARIRFGWGGQYFLNQELGSYRLPS